MATRYAIHRESPGWPRAIAATFYNPPWQASRSGNRWSRHRTREMQIHALFSRELEGKFVRRMSVLDYARIIGCSESTLSRACLASVGRTAKQEIDKRVALEAKRLLVHSTATAVEIVHRLGFTEPSNFVKFFRRNVGTTPSRFRARHSPAP